MSNISNFNHTSASTQRERGQSQTVSGRGAYGGAAAAQSRSPLSKRDIQSFIQDVDGIKRFKSHVEFAEWRTKDRCRLDKYLRQVLHLIDQNHRSGEEHIAEITKACNDLSEELARPLQRSIDALSSSLVRKHLDLYSTILCISGFCDSRDDLNYFANYFTINQCVLGFPLAMVVPAACNQYLYYKSRNDFLEHALTSPKSKSMIQNWKNELRGFMDKTQTEITLSTAEALTCRYDFQLTTLDPCQYFFFHAIGDISRGKTITEVSKSFIRSAMTCFQLNNPPEVMREVREYLDVKLVISNEGSSDDHGLDSEEAKMLNVIPACISALSEIGLAYNGDQAPYSLWLKLAYLAAKRKLS